MDTSYIYHYASMESIESTGFIYIGVYQVCMSTKNIEDSEAYQRLNITMPNEKVDEMDKERGNVPRSTYLSGLIGQREKSRGKTVVLPKYHRYLDQTRSWLYGFIHDIKDLCEVRDGVMAGMMTDSDAVTLNGRQLSLLTYKILEHAEQCRRKIENISNWTNRRRESDPSEYSKHLVDIADSMENLRGCVLHLRAFGVDEHIIQDVEAVYNSDIYTQGWLIDYVVGYPFRQSSSA